MLGEAEEKIEFQSVLCEVRTEVEETVELQTVLCGFCNEAEHQSAMREASSQPEETFQRQSLLQKSPMKQHLMIQTKCMLCGTQAEAEETLDHGAYHITQRNEMVEISLFCSKI